MYSDDLARIIKLTIDNDVTESFNIGYPENLSINEMAEKALKVTNNDYKIVYKHPELKGQPRKDISNSRLEKLFPSFTFTPFEEGVKKVYDSISK
jgi:nucleoside-diphosphate-sugar epimerase